MRPRSLALALLALGAISCSLLVGGEPEPMRCSAEGRLGPPACDAGLMCQSGLCRPVAGVPDAGGAGTGGDGAGGSD